MEIVRNLVLNLIVIAVLAVFLEMLLPAGDMRRYVKMVMGLLIVIAVLQAAGNLIRGGWQLDMPVPAQTGPSPGAPGLPDIMAGGRRLAADTQAQALEQYRQGLALQIAALAGMNGRLTVREVEVDLYGDKNDKKFGQIRQVQLLFDAAPAAAEQKNPLVGPVKVEVGKNAGAGGNAVSGRAQPPPEVEQAARRAAANVANFYNLSPEQVKFEFRTAAAGG
ncbi:stage III sporulation protein AF [Desulfotomaculum copahuensis]|uniref:Stage III sporulation protein AF n=1 Tax=Desulfotomaculum copahuensis TaxID=1838280 RepID=A0A1B7LIZ0_9FIRM|nr:stage III sporulation protein AF [Desulfotomaculum copahuensis]OAT86537.1 hypothetical protein A6M21_03775 [Desulfotomaculum copahuensis]